MSSVVVNLATGEAAIVEPSIEDVAQRDQDAAAAAAAAAQAMPGLIKAEARKRILAAYPDWMQTNMVARGVELLQIKADGGQWSASEVAEAAALQSAWDWIKQVRAASNAIEADPPINYTNDAHWPSNL